LKFTKIALEAISSVYFYKWVLLRTLAFPFIVGIFLELIQSEDIGSLIRWFCVILTIIVQTFIAITTHRIILLGQDSIPKWGLYKWSFRETFFTFHLIGLFVLMLVAKFLILIPYVGWITAIILIYWIFPRLSLAFPGIAVDQAISFKLAWRLTKNHQLLMFLVVIVFPLILLLPVIPLTFVPHTSVIITFLISLATVFMVAALSLTYKMIYQEYYDSE
jgi:hypothetical protein